MFARLRAKFVGFWKAASLAVGGWFNLMSGGLSAVLAILGLFHPGPSARLYFGVGFAALFYLTIKIAYRNWKLLTPIFDIACAPDILGCRVAGGAGGGYAYWLRAKIRNRSSQTIHGCRGAIMRVLRDNNVVMGHQKRTITFDPGHHPDSAAKTIGGYGEETLNVLAITYAGTVFFAMKPPELARDEVQNPVFVEPGEYIIEVEIYGDRASAFISRFRFNWDGNWQNAELRYLDTLSSR